MFYGMYKMKPDWKCNIKKKEKEYEWSRKAQEKLVSK